MAYAMLYSRQKTISNYLKRLFPRTLCVLVVVGSCVPVFGQTVRSTFYDGSANAYVRYPHEARFDSSVIMTVEAWIKPSTPFGLNPTIVSHGSSSSYWFGLEVVTTTTARLRFGRSGTSVASTGTIGAGRWSHVAAVYNGSVVNFYIDGNFSNSVVLGNTGSGVNSSLFIGGQEGGCCTDPAGLSFHGMIDEVRIWSISQSLLQLRNNMYKQVRGAAGLVAAWGTGGLHEDEGGVTGIDGGGTAENIEGMVPHELVVPLAALPGNMVVDGDIDRAFEYVGGEQMVVRYGAGSNATVGLANVHLVHTDTDLYIGIRTISSPVGGWDPGQSFVGFMFDPDYSRDSLAQSTDFRITSNLGSQNRKWEVGNGTGGFDLLSPLPPGDPIDHAVSSCGEFGEVCIEIRIAKSLMGEWTDTDGFAIGHLDLSASLDDYLAPGGAIWNAPNTWGTLQYNESSPILPRARINGAIPEGKCVGGDNDLNTCASDGECPSGDCVLEGRTVWLMSPLRDAPLYTTTTGSNGAFAFRDGFQGVLVPPNTTLTVQAEGCSGCLYPDAIVDPVQIESRGIHPVAVHGLSVTFPSPCDACSGSCSVGSTCIYPHITFAIRQPPGPTTVTDITPSALHKEIVLRDFPRKTIPPTRVRIRGENFHEFMDVYLDGNCTSFPDGCDRVPMVIVDRGTDDIGDWLDVELHEDYPSSGVRNITIRDRWVWGRSSGVLGGWIRAGSVSWDGGGEYPQLWGFEFINEGSEGSWGAFSNAFGNNAYICLSPFPEVGGTCLGCRVPRPYYLLYFVAYKIAIENTSGNCVGMASTSQLFRLGDLDVSDFTSGVHFPSGLPGIAPDDGHTHHIHAPQPGRFGFEACGPWNRENLFSFIRANHGVQMSAEFMRELFNDFTGGAFSTDGNPMQVLSDVYASSFNNIISVSPSLDTGHAITPYGAETVGRRCDGGCNDLAECTTDADCLPCDESCALFAVDECPADTIGDCTGGTCAGGCNNGNACTSGADCPDCDAACDRSHVNRCGDPNELIGRCRQFSKIKVYDNNWPENKDRGILIDEDRNKYRFNLGSKIWRGNGIYSIPISVWQNKRTAPGLQELADFILSFTFGSADALYSNSTGGEWGWRSDGTVVDAMPGAVASVPLEEDFTFEFSKSRSVLLLLPAAAEMPTVDLHGRGGDFGFHSALGGTSVQLQGFDSHEGDENRVQLFRDGDRIGGMSFTPSQNGTRFVPKLGAEPTPNESMVFHWVGLDVRGGDSVRFDIFPEEFGVGMDNDGETPATFYLMVESVDGLAEAHSRNLFGPFSVPAGARHRANVDDWPVAGFLRSEIDMDRDGVPEIIDVFGARSCGGLEGGPPLDLNHNGVPDECETGGDTNGDTLIDLEDYRLLWKCLRGPNVPYLEPECSTVDLDFDADVDLQDYGLYELNFNPSQQQPHECCDPGPTGCDDPTVEACVCAQDSFCCEEEWDEQCTFEVYKFACGECAVEHKCCETGGPGCDDQAVESCVCAGDPTCCFIGWDEICVENVQDNMCGICDGLPDCCSPTGVGCGHPLIEACVCAEDDYCCSGEWDQRCVDLVDLLGCGTCTPHDCCITGGPGCADPAIEACVCEGDPACCNNQWDRLCIEEISTFGCGTCGDHSCCEIGTAGCADAEVLACVCTQDPFCCTEEWDQRCIDEVSDFACGSCENDNCLGAEAVVMPASIIGNTTDGLLYDAPVCNGVDVTSTGRWYTVVGTGATITASTCSEFVDFDTQISVFEGDCASLSCVAANDDNCNILANSSTVSWCSTPGVTYRILVHGYGSETGGFYLSIYEGNVCNILDAFVHTSKLADTTGNNTFIDRVSTNNQPGNLLYITQNWNPGGGGGQYNDHPVGLWYNLSKWYIFNEDLADMVFNASFNVAVLPPTDLSYRHTADAGNIFDHYTLLDHPNANGNPNAIVMVSQYWGTGLFGIYNDSPIGVWYDSFSSKWSIFNEDLSAMPTNAKFNVAIYDATDTVFVHKATIANSGASSTAIDHAATNNNPNAIILVTQNWNPGDVGGIYNNAVIGVWYDGSKWNIYNQDLSSIPVGASFNVVIMP